MYAAGDLTLALLERLVHVVDANAFRSLGHVHREVTFPDDTVSVVEQRDLPRGWDASRVSLASPVAGDGWLDAKTSLVLAVPSPIVVPAHRYHPTYMNYLVDPRHPDFPDAIDAGTVLDLAFDDRLVR